MKILITGIRKIKNLFPLSSWPRTQLSKIIGFFERLTNAVKMFFVVLDVVAWDHSSIYIILEAWLGRMQKVHEEDEWHTRAEDNVKDIKSVRFALKRLIADDYSAYNAHNARWGEPEMNWDPAPNGNSFLRIEHAKANTPELKEQERNEFRQAIKLDQYLEDQDMNYVFTMLKKHMRKWWT